MCIRDSTHPRWNHEDVTHADGGGDPASAAPPAATAERDRVLDAVKAFALAVVVLAHSIAWDVSSGDPKSVLDVRPDIAWATWTLQILPLFFAAGAVANLGSWQRNPDAATFLRRRLVRLATPGLVYAAFWTLLLLPLAAFLPEAELAGRFLAQLLWFLGVYGAAVVAVPWTARWARRPVLTLGIWLGVIVVVDVVRLTAVPAVGWLNLVLVWVWLHQLGYHLPQLRRLRPARLVGLAVVPLALALALALPGPYSSSLVTHAGDPEPSNLSPPTVVVALYGLAQILVLCALWPRLKRLLDRERVWLATGFIAMRAISVYLWHIPWVLIVAATAWLLDFGAEPLDRLWWLAHLAGLAVILTMAWFTAGIGARWDQRAARWGASQRPRILPAAPFAILIPVSLLAMTVTGFGTWWDVAFLGIPTSSALNLAVLAVAWWALTVGRQDTNRSP